MSKTGANVCGSLKKFVFFAKIYHHGIKFITHEILWRIRKREVILARIFAIMKIL
jgi:hypothetical protein